MNQPKLDFSQLSIAERIQLVEDIWDSIAAENPTAVELSEGQRNEVRRRAEAHDANPDTSIPWEQVRSELLSAITDAR